MREAAEEEEEEEEEYDAADCMARVLSGGVAALFSPRAEAEEDEEVNEVEAGAAAATAAEMSSFCSSL